MSWTEQRHVNSDPNRYYNYELDCCAKISSHIFIYLLGGTRCFYECGFQDPMPVSVSVYTGHTLQCTLCIHCSVCPVCHQCTQCTLSVIRPVYTSYTELGSGLQVFSFGISAQKPTCHLLGSPQEKGFTCICVTCLIGVGLPCSVIFTQHK